MCSYLYLPAADFTCYIVFASPLTAVSTKLAIFKVTVMNVTNVQIGLSEVLETGKGMLECQKSVGLHQ